MAKIDLPHELIDAGAALLGATGSLAMQAQGAMWVYDYSLGEWRYYLVTSLVDTLGRRKTYKLLLQAFEKLSLPPNMSVDDVHLGSPTEEFFQLVISVIVVKGDSRTRFNNCVFNGVQFDGLVYRAQGAPPGDEASRIEKRFAKKVKDLA